MENQPTWYDLEMLPLCVNMSHSTFDLALSDLKNLQSYVDDPLVIEMEDVNRIIKTYEEQTENLRIYEEQCKKWRVEFISKKQLSQIKKIENTVIKLKNIYEQLLTLAYHFKIQAIDHVVRIEKDTSIAIERMKQILEA
jgi:hypothetical protein